MKKIVSTALLILSTTLLVADEAKEYNTAMKLSTLGLGFDISTPINDKLSARFNLNGASYSDTQSEDGNDYEGSLELLTAGILLDYYPFQNNFRLSSGVYYNGNGFTGSVTPTSTTTVEIGGTTYTNADIGSLNTDISFNSLAPYLGLGWGNNARDKGWGFTFDLGAMFHGTGEANLNATVINQTIANQIASDIAKEEQDINDNLADIKVYPVVSIGVNYSF